MEKLQERKRALLPLVQQAVEAFLEAHPGLQYYCFAFDCNAEYGEINLCLNTEEAFESAWRRYQSGPYGKAHPTQEERLSFRYNPGNWNYQCFETFYVLDDDELFQRYGDDGETRIAEMMRFNYDLLAQFCKTETFARIAKTKNFRVLCIDHDESEDDALRKTDQFVR